MLKKIAISLGLTLIALSGCQFPQPHPGDAEMEVENSEWATLSTTQRQAAIAGYADDRPVPYSTE